MRGSGMAGARTTCGGAILGSLVAALSTIVTSRAEAHVKWFCGPVDVTAPPVGLHGVLSPTLLAVAIGSMILVSAGSLADSAIEQRWPGLHKLSHPPEMIEELIVRVGIGFFLVMLWLNA